MSLPTNTLAGVTPHHMYPITTLPTISAKDQLCSIIAIQWPTYVQETVSAMFLLRTRRVMKAINCKQLQHTTDIEQYRNSSTLHWLSIYNYHIWLLDSVC